MKLADLSDEELFCHLQAICGEGQRLLARLIAHLIEVEERRLHLKVACSSLFDFCIRRLGMSEGAAFRRINAARLVQRLPGLLGSIERGEIHLSALVLLRDHLTKANVDELVAAASGKSKREVEELLARRAPKADVPSTIRKLPGSTVANATLSLPSGGTGAPAVEARPQARIEPLSEARYKVQLTASTELRDKLERARDLMRHRNPSGDLAVIVERALDVLLEKLEKERLGKTARPQRNGRRAKAGRVQRAVRREVFARDGEQCSFVDAEGRRCPARAFLELDHIESRALGGADDAANLRIRCRPHNLLHAEQVFGQDHVAGRIHFRQRKSLLTAPVAESEGRQTTETGPARETFDLARRGLVSMGFREAEARRAVSAVTGRHPDDGPALPIEQLLREALAALT